MVLGMCLEFMILCAMSRIINNSKVFSPYTFRCFVHMAQSQLSHYDIYTDVRLVMFLLSCKIE
jgi:hypothetical protein